MYSRQDFMWQALSPAIDTLGGYETFAPNFKKLNDQYQTWLGSSEESNVPFGHAANCLRHVWLAAPIHRQRCFSEILVRGDFGCGSSFGFFTA